MLHYDIHWNFRRNFVGVKYIRTAAKMNLQNVKGETHSENPNWKRLDIDFNIGINFVPNKQQNSQLCTQ